MQPFLLLALFCLLGTTKSTLLDDAIALASLVKSFHSSGPALEGWSTSNLGLVCTWGGVRCVRGRVVSVNLSNSNISGTIAGVITGLYSLVDFSVAGNELTGDIRFSNLPSLRYLNISTNQFNGGLDWDYSSLPSLEVFDAYDNNFTNQLPLGVLDSMRIRYLELGGNFFYGRIPASYGSFRELEYLSLSGNDLRGGIPVQLGNLTSLKQLYLGYFNALEGGIPDELGKLINLVHLDLSSCGLDGEIPSSLGNLISLDTLFLHSNLLSGSIPVSLRNLSKLVSFDLSNNGLTGEIPHELAGLTKLSLVNLFMNRLHGSIPEFIAGLRNLQILQLFMNNFTGTIPGQLGFNGAIQTIDLSSNKLTGTIPDGLCSSNQLTVLILLKNFLFGPIPESLGKCSSLIRVRLGSNYLNGSIPSGFLYLPQLNLLELQNNYLTGSISENSNITEGSSSSRLGQLNLSNNLLSGSIPSSISNLSSLETLLMSDNRLVAEIPTSIGQLRWIVKLDLSQNNLSGKIPPEIGNCSQLAYLDLSQNYLSGEIPAEIGRVGILNYMNLSRNHLVGEIPESIGTMRSLTAADFSFNDLAGRLPTAGQLAYFNASSFAGNPHLCGAALSIQCGGLATVEAGSAPHARTALDYKLFFALGLLLCSLLFAAVAVAKARSHRSRLGRDTWRMTAFHNVGFGLGDVLECMKDCNVIGRGGAGVVYLGRNNTDGDRIAVKRLMGFGSNGHDHGFRAEIRTLGSIRHRNIVRLLAYCTNSCTNLLVYEYMSNGSLGEVLHGKGGEFLGWDRRYRIAVEAARGLCYLHHDCSPMIVHRDVKSNNILLDAGFEAHMADFGLAKFLTDGGRSECMSAIAGSYGYIAPEYAYTLKVDEKSDVYSFGVVLLELITGRKPVGEFGEGVDIVQWAKRANDCTRDYVAGILDPKLSAVPIDEATHVFFVAMLCIHENCVERPTMREVVQMLLEFPRHTPDEQSSSSSSSAALEHKVDSSSKLI